MFAERLKIARASRGHSQESLGQIVNLPRQQIYRWESGGVIPNSDTVVMLARALEVSADYLLGLSDDMNGHAEYNEELTPDERRALASWRRGDKLGAIKAIVGE